MANTANIPIIDLSGHQKEVANQLVNAAEEHGFIYIRNLGKDITPEAVDRAFKISAKTFASPDEEKKACAIQTNNRGWSAMHGETLDPKHQRIGDSKEAFNFGEFVDGKAQQPIPSTIAEDEPQIDAFAASCRALCTKILFLLGLGLGVDDFFSSAHFSGESGTVLRFLRYPPPGGDAGVADESDIRAGAHSDYGSITLLFRLKGQAGLEVLKKDNSWAPVPVSPPGTENDPSPPILINIGDLLSYWTNGLFRSTVHRVVMPNGSNDSAIVGETSTEPRYSIAFFCHPVGSTALEAVPSERVRSFVPDEKTPNLNPYAERSVITAQEHLLMRLKETYRYLYKEKN